jgi:hypothetical protein
VAPSSHLFPVDGYRWLLGDKRIKSARSRRLRLTAADAGRRLACHVTVTYPAPFMISVSSTSPAVDVSERRR